MQATDKPEFLKVINGIAAIRKSPITAEALDLWWGCMQDWDIGDFKVAAIQVLKTATFMPTPKDFEDLRKAGRETAGEVFANIRHWIVYSPHGHTLREDTPRPIAAAIRAMGGPSAYMMSDQSALPFLERRFCQHYDEIMGREDTREALPQIAYHDDETERLEWQE